MATLPPALVLLPDPPSPAPSRCSPPRQFSRSEKMLLATLRRADEQLDTKDSDNDYFTMGRDLMGGGYPTSDRRHHSRAPSHNGSPVRSLANKPSSTPILSPSSRSASPATSRFVERDRISRRRTPSPSPHPYLPSTRPTQPSMQRTQTSPAPLSQYQRTGPSRPRSPVQGSVHRRASSPGRYQSRYRSPSASASKPRTPQEDLLRARLEGVLAASAAAPLPSTTSPISMSPEPESNTGSPSTSYQPYQSSTATSTAYGVMTPAGRSRGPSISSTHPPFIPGVTHATASGDHWTWGAGPGGYSVAGPPVYVLAPAGAAPTISVPTSPRSNVGRALSVSRTNNAPYHTASTKSPRPQHGATTTTGYTTRDTMITPPPSPPYEDDASSSGPASRSSSSQAITNGMLGLGMGHPSTRSSSSHNSSSSTPAPANSCFDARSASLMLRDQHGYVSFCDIEGLGEPSEGVDGDSSGEDGELCTRGRGRWWEVWRK